MSNNAMRNDDLRKQAWDFFYMQAGHRLTTFNFYIVTSSVLTTALCASFKTDFAIPCVGVALGLILAILSFLFWKLDQRNRFLIQGAERTLMFFEKTAELPDAEDGGPHIAKRFTREDYETRNERSLRSWRLWRSHYSYSECFRFLFVIFASVGIAGAVLSGSQTVRHISEMGSNGKPSNVVERAQPAASRPFEPAN